MTYTLLCSLTCSLPHLLTYLQTYTMRNMFACHILWHMHWHVCNMYFEIFSVHVFWHLLWQVSGENALTCTKNETRFALVHFMLYNDVLFSEFPRLLYKRCSCMCPDICFESFWYLFWHLSGDGPSTEDIECSEGPRIWSRVVGHKLAQGAGYWRPARPAHS